MLSGAMMVVISLVMAVKVWQSSKTIKATEERVVENTAGLWTKTSG